MQIIEQLNAVIEKNSLLTHPFYQAWSAGKLNREVLQTYAAQYYAHVASFPRFISRVHTECPAIEARKVLLQNLADEEISGTDHPTLWMQFAKGLGATEEQVLNQIPLPETAALIDTFNQLAAKDWRDGLCALFAYESQVPAVSQSKIEGLKKWYGIQDEATLEFFTAHQAYDVEHARQIAGLIERYVDSNQALLATEQATRALWQFLDGMCTLAGIECKTH